jgi:hypothetical protein
MISGFCLSVLVSLAVTQLRALLKSFHIYFVHPIFKRIAISHFNHHGEARSILIVNLHLTSYLYSIPLV